MFGGRGTLWGTLLGLFSLSVLQNGLHLAALPSELTGVLTGTLLVATIAIDRLRDAASAPVDAIISEEEIHVKNSQVAVLCGAILAGALIVAGTNVVARALARPRRASPAAAGAAPAARTRRHRDDAEGEGRSVLRQLPRRRRGGGAASWASI